MMGERTVLQESLFYSFNLDRHVPMDHLLRSVDRFVDLSGIRQHLLPYYSEIGRPSIDPELMIRMLLVGYCFGIRSERRLCDEVHLNLGYRWFCRLSLDAAVPDHSTFSKARHGRFRDADLLCSRPWSGVAWPRGSSVARGLRSVAAWSPQTQAGNAASKTRGELKPDASRAIVEYLAVLDDAAFGAATPVQPKFISPVDPAARWTAASDGPAVFAYADNYLIDLKCAVILDVEPTTAVRQAEVTAAKTMIVRTAERLGMEPARLAADTGYGSAEMLGWLIAERGIEPHIPVFDKSARKDGSLARADFIDSNTCVRLPLASSVYRYDNRFPPQHPVRRP